MLYLLIEEETVIWKATNNGDAKLLKKSLAYITPSCSRLD